MTIEEKLKDLILSRYKSVREFAISIDMPPTTVITILKRGVNNSSLNNVSKVCTALRISLDELANGNIVSKPIKKDDTSTVEISSVIKEAKSIISFSDNLTINGKKIDVEFADPIIDALDIGYEMVKRKSDHNKRVEMYREKLTEIDKRSD